MGRGDDNDERDAEAAAPTLVRPAILDDTEADQTPIDDTDDGPQTLRSPVPDDDAAPTEVVGHRRKPGLWFPLIVFVLLIVAGAYVGRFVVPQAGPDRGAVPQASGGASTGPGNSTVTVGPTRPNLATPPARPADELRPWATQVGTAAAIPAVAMQAYGYAQLSLQRTDPACHLGWTTLAGIGQVESQHGQAGGAILQESGRSAPLITGEPQDGKGGRPLVADTDAGAFDGDVTYDRPMGPLRLMPSVWRAFAIDADGDGILDPYDIDDSALTLARLLCSGTEDLSQLSGWNAAIARHHAGSAYAKSVFTTADGYGQKTRAIG